MDEPAYADLAFEASTASSKNLILALRIATLVLSIPSLMISVISLPLYGSVHRFIHTDLALSLIIVAVFALGLVPPAIASVLNDVTLFLAVFGTFMLPGTSPLVALGVGKPSFLQPLHTSLYTTSVVLFRLLCRMHHHRFRVHHVLLILSVHHPCPTIRSFNARSGSSSVADSPSVSYGTLSPGSFSSQCLRARLCGWLAGWHNIGSCFLGAASWFWLPTGTVSNTNDGRSGPP